MQVSRTERKIKLHLYLLLIGVFILFMGLLKSVGVSAQDSIDPSTLYGKLIMGYQGWFSCPGDPVLPGWNHWKGSENFTVEMLPDISEAASVERCATNLEGQDGQAVYLFSSQNSATVDRHFEWMEHYGIDGVALQKFSSQVFNKDTQKRSDLVLDHVRASAEKHNRVFFIMYDLSGMTSKKLEGVADDYKRLMKAGITQSVAYLRHRGHPLLGLWGIGFGGRSLSPDAVSAFLSKIREESAPYSGVTILGGVPAYWRTGKKDADPNPEWKTVWPKIDVISPWTVGRYTDSDTAIAYKKDVLELDISETAAMGVDYMPVIFPGFSWSNLMRARHEDKKVIPNEIPRLGGAFYWTQARNAIDAGVRMIYNAMFDEVDEGTAMFKIESHKIQSPINPPFLTLDADGYNLPSDWYLHLAGKVNGSLRNSTKLETMPVPPK